MARFVVELRNNHRFNAEDQDVEAYLGYKHDEEGENTGRLQAINAERFKDESYLPFWETEGAAASAVRKLNEFFLDRYLPTVRQLEGL